MYPASSATTMSSADHAGEGCGVGGRGVEEHGGNQRRDGERHDSADSDTDERQPHGAKDHAELHACGVAPSAMRMPISSVWRVTE